MKGNIIHQMTGYLTTAKQLNLFMKYVIRIDIFA